MTRIPDLPSLPGSEALLERRTSVLSGPGQSIERKKEEARQVAKDFEALFFSMMLSKMRETAKSDDESNAMSIFGDMLVQEYSKISDGRLGVSELVYKSLLETDPGLADGRKNKKVSY